MESAWFKVGELWCPYETVGGLWEVAFRVQGIRTREHLDNLWAAKRTSSLLSYSMVDKKLPALVGRKPLNTSCLFTHRVSDQPSSPPLLLSTALHAPPLHAAGIGEYYWTIVEVG